MPLITLPTRITNSSKTLIDNIFCNQFSRDIVSGNITVSISDHIPQFAIIPFPNRIKGIANKNTLIRNYKNFDTNNFQQEVNRIKWSFVSPENESEINDNTIELLSKIETVLNKYAPLRKLTNREHKQRNKPWITRGLIKSIKLKDKIYSKFFKEKDKNRKEMLHADLKIRKNLITGLIRKSKKDFYNKFFLENSNNTRKLWLGINELINCKQTSHFVPNCIEEKTHKDITTLTDPKTIANSFNNYFTSIANELLKDRKYPGNKHFSSYLSNPNNASFMIKPTDIIEIESLIMLINTTKGTGPNSIPNKVIQLIIHDISMPIMIICNKSFTSGSYPQILKLSKVIPIHKKESKLKISNYRPISLLSNLNKILEKLMFKRLYNFFEIHQCIYELQFGFRAKHSTDHAILSMAQEIRQAMDNDNVAIGVFVDFQKAFDTVNHEILLSKLSHYGIRGICNDWIRSYLTNRRQFVSINGSNSTERSVKHGVPQGSVLGPLLFLIYINDLHNCIKNSKTRHFADDTNLLYISNKKNRNRNITRKLNTDLKSLNNWLLSNKISLNSTKTEIIYFRKSGTSIPNVKVKLRGSKITPSSEVKYVGLTFDEHMNFKSHIMSLNAKLKRANNLLAISRHHVPKTLLLQIYYGQFFSHLTYGCQVWGQQLSEISPTFILQKKALRLIKFEHYQAHTNPIFKELKLLKLMDVIRMKNLLLVHNTLNLNIPTHFQNYFSLKTTKHKYRTINNPNSLLSIPKGSVVLPDVKGKHGEQSVKHICAKTWNKTLKALLADNQKSNITLDTNLHEMNINKFKNILKQFFIDSY